MATFEEDFRNLDHEAVRELLEAVARHNDAIVELQAAVRELTAVLGAQVELGSGHSEAMERLMDVTGRMTPVRGIASFTDDDDADDESDAEPDGD